MVRDLTGKHPNYFESILQLRDCNKEVIDFVEDEIVKKIVKLSKMARVKNGFDYYLSDNTLTKQIAKRVKDKFGGQLLETSTLHTKIDDKEKFRVTTLFRQAHFNKGDIVIYQGDEYTVKMMTKDIFMQNNKTGKKVHVKFSDMKQVSKV